MAKIRVVIQKPVNSSSLGVQTVTGDGVNNTDPQNPILSFPDTSEVTETTDKKYVTDAEKVVIGNTSGTNTGDQDLSGLQPILSEGVFVDGDKTKLDNQSNTNTGDETTATIQAKRPVKTIDGDSLEGAGNIVTGAGSITVEGTIEDTNTLNAVSGNAVYEKSLQDRFQFSDLYDRSVPLRANFRYGGIIGITYIEIGTPAADINSFDLYLRYFRNNGSGALVQIVKSDLTPIAQLNRSGVLQSGIEKANLVQLNGFEYIFYLEFDWDSVQNYYDGDLGTTVKIDTEKLFFNAEIASFDYVTNENTQYNYSYEIEFDYNETAFDPVTGILSDPTNLKATYDSKGVRRFLEAGDGVGSSRIENFKCFDDTYPLETQILYFDMLRGATNPPELKIKSRTDIVNFPVAEGYTRKAIGYARYDASNLRYSLISDFLRISSYNGTSGIKTPQIQKNTESIVELETKSKLLGVRSKYDSSVIENQTPFYTNLLNLDRDLEIALIGDSLFALTSSAGDVEDGTLQANRPPSMQFDAYCFRLWFDVVNNKPDYDRYDSAINTFTETGTFTDSYTDWNAPDWTAEYRSDGSLTRFSSDTNAEISLNWDLSTHEKLNFIHRKTPDGSQNLTVTIDLGNGNIEVYNGSTWVEANGFTFDQYIDPSISLQNSGYSLYLANVKLKFRRVTSATTANITINKPVDGTTLYYWGTERWNGNSIFITNVARGGRTSSYLQNNMLNDLGQRDLDFVIVEPPLT